MNTNDLYLEYARVIKMCEGTELEDTPWVCVKVNGRQFGHQHRKQDHPHFSRNPKCYEFAVAVLEVKPIFVGDRIYARSPNYDMLNGAIVTKTAHGNTVAEFYDGNQIKIDRLENSPETYFTWTPPAPKRTFTLNGVELPCPAVSGKVDFKIFDINFSFESMKDYLIIEKEFLKILTEARDRNDQKS